MKTIPLELYRLHVTKALFERQRAVIHSLTQDKYQDFFFLSISPQS